MQMNDYRSYSMILGVAVSRRVVYGIISKTGSGMKRYFDKFMAIGQQ